MRKGKSTSLSNFITFLFALYAIGSIAPFLYVLMGSFQSNEEILTFSFSFADRSLLTNYKEAVKSVNIGGQMLNSFIISVISVVIMLILSILIAYALSRYDFSSRNKVKSYFMLGMMIPVPALMMPSYVIGKWLGTSNTPFALIGPYVALGMPMSIMVIMAAIQNLPKGMEEAAFIDGCNVFGVIMQIVLPSIRPAIASAAILAFLNNWNEFSLAVVLISKEHLKTLPMGLATFKGMHSTFYGKMFAAIVIAIIPIIIVYALLQKHIMKGITEGAIKG